MPSSYSEAMMIIFVGVNACSYVKLNELLKMCNEEQSVSHWMSVVWQICGGCPVVFGDHLIENLKAFAKEEDTSSVNG